MRQKEYYVPTYIHTYIHTYYTVGTYVHIRIPSYVSTEYEYYTQKSEAIGLVSIRLFGHRFFTFACVYRVGYRRHHDSRVKSASHTSKLDDVHNNNNNNT